VHVQRRSFTINDRQLSVVKSFCYLGSYISWNGSLDEELSSRLQGLLQLWQANLSSVEWSRYPCGQSIRVDIKVSVYKAVVLTTLLYGCEAWTPCHRHIRKLDKFRLRCLRKILPSVGKTKCFWTMQNTWYRSHDYYEPVPMGWLCFSHCRHQNSKTSLLCSALCRWQKSQWLTKTLHGPS